MNVEEWLGKDNLLGIDIWRHKYCYQGETFDEWVKRVSGNNEELGNLIKEKKFLFGGRALANRGTDKDGTMFNCYSSGYVEDSIPDILQTNTNLALTYKAQGGQGVSLTKLRPKGTPIKKNYVSDGIIPFMEIFNTTTASISQGGARKGALMMSIDIRHKEADTFITIKANTDKITNANLSLEIDDEFMKAVQEYYKTGDIITLHETRDYDGHLVEYDLIPINLYKLMVETVYDWGEPGCIFTNRFRNYNLMELDDEYEIATCNPCGEQPLPKNFSCNLGSLNVSEFIINPYTDRAKFNFEEFKKAVRIAVKGLDDIIDENAKKHALKEQSQNSKNYRNMGLGVFGYANALFKLQLTYGSKKAKAFTEKLFKELFIDALEMSNELAITKGAFPKCKPELIFNSKIIKDNVDDPTLLENIRKFGLRNCSLISIAPTGSIATLLNCSGGCEPEFALSYNRRTINLGDTYKVYCRSVQEYFASTGTKEDSELPGYFVASQQINWKDRVDTQAIMQKYTDTAISSTINLADDTPKEEVEKIYLYAWEQGLKGLTLFRDNCKRTAILTTNSEVSEVHSVEDVGKEGYTKVEWGTVLPVRDDLDGIKTKIKNGCGHFHLQLFYDEKTGKPWETFISMGSGGGCERNLETISKLISDCLRAGVPIEHIIKKLKQTRACPAYINLKNSNIGKKLKGGEVSQGTSCPSAIAFALENFMKKIESKPKACTILQEDVQAEIKAADGTTVCPECGEQSLIKEGGCNRCLNCGYTKCD